MHRRFLLASLALAPLAPAAARAQAEGEAAVLRAALAAANRGNWPEAQRIAAARPLPAKLVRWLALVAGPAEPDEAAAFLAANPDWPLAEAIRRRAEAVLAFSGSDESLRAWTGRLPALTPALKLRLVPLLPPREAAAMAHAAWIEAPADEAFERRVLDQAGLLLTAEDHVARFERLAWAGQAQAAGRLLPLLPAPYAPTARAWLDLLAGRDAPDLAPANPGPFLRRARLLRTQDRDAEALAWWARAPAVREPERAAQLWAERQTMARRTLRLRDPRAAQRLAAAHGLAGGTEAEIEARFVSGWLALRFAEDARTAAASFDALVGVAVSPISAARGHYWRGRAAAALGQDARPHYESAARHPAAYYGQLAILALGEGEAGITRRLTALPQPAPDEAAMRLFLNRELARAARLLNEAGERGRARTFLLRIEALAADAETRARTAALAAAIGRPDVGVEIARRAGPRDGATLLEAGWPAPVDPPAGTDRALVLALMRQESNFAAEAVSPVGARGLMQLMPATARTTARRLGVPTNEARLVSDPQHNMLLGAAYLAELMTQFDNAVPLALAGYNAGPHRVTQWLAEAGDPRIPPAQGGADPIDWIERIPFTETRNYVQRVIEGVMVYRARFNEPGRHPVLALGGA